LKITRIERDPTKQAGTRRRFMANIRRRLKGAYVDVRELISELPGEIVNNKVSYVYELDDSRVQNIDERIREIINFWFQTQTNGKPARFFFDPYIGASYAMGTADSIDRTERLAGIAGYSTADLSQLDVEQIYSSGIYRRRVELVFGRAFNEMKGFSGDTATDLARVLSKVVANGDSPREAQRLIRERFRVADSRAERISRTEINRAYNIARSEQAEDTSERLGIDVRLIHRSSLVPTTRILHAARHGNVYTKAEQREWWDTGSNRINCLCSVSEIVFDEDGKPFDDGIIKKMKEQKKLWLPTR
jgi:hypothetical protein